MLTLGLVRAWFCSEDIINRALPGSAGLRLPERIDFASTGVVYGVTHPDVTDCGPW